MNMIQVYITLACRTLRKSTRYGGFSICAMPLTYIFPTTTCRQDLNLPPAVNGVNTELRMAITFAWEEGNSLQAEVDLASQCCRQMLFATQTYAVCAERLSKQLDAATKCVHVSCCEYTNIFPFSPLLFIVSITFLISFRSYYLNHAI